LAPRDSALQGIVAFNARNCTENDLLYRQNEKKSQLPCCDAVVVWQGYFGSSLCSVDLMTRDVLTAKLLCPATPADATANKKRRLRRRGIMIMEKNGRSNARTGWMI
jgi:hypothetical protein